MKLSNPKMSDALDRLAGHLDVVAMQHARNWYSPATHDTLRETHSWEADPHAFGRKQR
jgi:hypothetical protein